MGADIAVEKEKGFHPVADVTASDILIKRGDATVKVSLLGKVNLLIKESLKVSESSVGVEDLNAERAYTYGADPFRQMVNAAGLATAENRDADFAQAELLRADMATAAAGGATAAEGTSSGLSAAQSQAAATVSQAYANQASNAFDFSAYSSRAHVAAGERMYDAIRLSFHVKPDKNLSKAYFAVIAEISEPDSKPGHVRKWAYVRSLDPLSAGESRKITVYEGGLPPGYILGNCEVHIYDGGTELATTLSSKQVPLTAEEALEFRIIEYVGDNKGRTLPAAPASTALSGPVRAALTPAQISETCYVRVAKDGRVTAAFADAAGKKPLKDDTLESALKMIRFKPALEAGKPVESIAPVKLGEFGSL